MSLQRSLSWSSALSDIRADRGLNAGAKIAAKRAAELQAMRDKNRAAAAAKAEGAAGYQLRPLLDPDMYAITLDGVRVAETGRDKTTGEWYLLADERLGKLPARFTCWHDWYASLDAVCAFLGARVTGGL